MLSLSPVLTPLLADHSAMGFALTRSLHQYGRKCEKRRYELRRNRESPAPALFGFHPTAGPCNTRCRFGQPLHEVGSRKVRVCRNSPAQYTFSFSPVLTPVVVGRSGRRFALTLPV